MSAYFTIVETPAGFLLLMLALALMLGQTAIFLLSLREHRSRGQQIVAALHLLFGFLLFVIMLESYDLVKYPVPKITRSVIPYSSLFRTLPWLLFVLLEAISAATLTLQLLAYRRYRRTNITPDAIRSTVDLLPEGLCVNATDGTVLLANLKMNALYRKMTGEVLTDSHRLWNWLEKNGEEQNGKRLIHNPEGETWLFSKRRLSVDGRIFERTYAINFTERYRITEELRKKNAHLQNVQRRMKEAVVLSGEMFVEQEEANARAALHNQLGQVLLMDRHWLEHPESTDGTAVATMTRQINSFLLGERKATLPETENGLEQTVLIAKSIGVTVELRGEPPRDGKTLALLGQAIRECAANTVKHAEGDRLFVELRHQTDGLAFSITNNGRPPKGPVVESGGLLSLRRAVETDGGHMELLGAPRFELRIKI